MPTPEPSTSATPGEPLSALHLLGPIAPPWWRRKTVWAATAVLSLSLAGAAVWWTQRAEQDAPVYVTDKAAKGNITLTISANGTLQPTRSVNIGSELSGTVQRVLVDVNDKVRKGQVLVELDSAKLRDQVAKSSAAVLAAQAAVAQADVAVKEAQAQLGRLREVDRLSGGKVPARAELETAQAALERTQAEAQSARANVAAAEATATTDRTNLSKASIRAPIDGVVLTRSVEPGNAVAASLQAVTLFTVAEDLSSMRLQVNVDEADVGAIQVGQKASFTVSTYPSRKFPAIITRVAYGSTTTDNVVTYVTYMNVDNHDLSLRPGMSATSTITAIERQDALLVPNTALRYSPTSGANAGAKSGGGLVASLMPRAPSTGGGGARKGGANPAQAKQVWVLRDGAPVAVAVRTGISDGRMTEIVGGELQPGMAVITDQRSAGARP